MVARRAERQRIGQLLAQVMAGRSRTLVVAGEAGIGKSWLCRRAAEAATGFQTAITRGVPSEAHLEYAGLLDICSPLLAGHLEQLPAPRAAALRSALRLAGSPIADALAVDVACLDLLAAAAERRPLLVIVDDAQWVDQASLAALRFTARRLDADAVALLFAVRSDEATDFADIGQEILHLTGLDELDSVALLDDCAPHPVIPAVARAVATATGGNPLALTEAARELTADQLAGQAALPDPLPTPDAIQRIFGRRVGALPSATRGALVVLAADETAPRRVLEAALSKHGTGPGALEAAQRPGLLATMGERPHFAHPLARSAVLHEAGLAARRRAHRALAVAWSESGDDERAAWHLSEAITGPDPALAVALTNAGRAARTRGAPRQAADAFRRAARSCGAPDAAGRLLYEAATDLALAGQGAELLTVLDQIAAAAPSPELAADAAMLRAPALLWSGRLAEASPFLEEAARRIRSRDPARAVSLLCAAAWALNASADVRGSLATARQASALAASLEGTVAAAAAQLTVAWALILVGDRAQGYPLFRESLELMPDPHDPLQVGLPRATPFGQIACWVEDYGTAQRELRAAVKTLRARGVLGDLPYSLAALSELEYRLGDWVAARAHAQEAVRLADDTGQHAPYALTELARLDAVTGNVADARAGIKEALDRARGQVGSLTIYGYATLGLLELCTGHPELAVGHLGHTAELVARSGLGEPNVVHWAPDLIESQLQAGHTTDATETLTAFERQAQRTGGRWALAAAARCRALLASPSELDGTFERAQRLSERVPSPFERARLELCWGERLRRDGRRVEARRRLRAGLERFEALGATPWADKTARELRSSGARARRGPRARRDELTPQETQIAAAVAEGKTNREIAAALFLSPKTVEFHLSHAFRKLGVHSRTQLTRRLLLPATTDPPAGDGTAGTAEAGVDTLPGPA